MKWIVHAGRARGGATKKVVLLPSTSSPPRLTSYCVLFVLLLRNLGVRDDALGQPVHAVRAVLTPFDALQPFEVRLSERYSGRHDLFALVVVDGAGEDREAVHLAALHLGQRLL